MTRVACPLRAGKTTTNAAAACQFHWPGSSTMSGKWPTRPPRRRLLGFQVVESRTNPQAERVAASRPGGLDPTQFGAATTLRTAPGAIDPLAASMQSLYLSGGGGGGGYAPGLSATQMAALQVSAQETHSVRWWSAEACSASLSAMPELKTCFCVVRVHDIESGGSRWFYSLCAHLMCQHSFARSAAW